MRKFIFLLFLSISIHGLSQEFSELSKLVAFDRANGDRFGYAVDIFENFAIIGAYGDDFSDVDPNMGSAYIFEKSGIADWTLVQKINNLDQDDYDRFGWSVAISDKYAVIGAYAEDEDLSDANTMSDAGSVYIFERTDEGEWLQVQKIIASDRSIGAEFGWSVDIMDSTIAIGAHFDNYNEAGTDYIYHAGAVYLFELGADGVWFETQKIVASDRTPDITEPDGGAGEDLSDQFGGDLSLDLPYLVVGAHHHDLDTMSETPISQAGAAYVFEKSAGIWTESTKLQASDRAFEDRFGYAVSIDSTTIVVGAYSEDHNSGGTEYLINSGSAYIFKKNEAGFWPQEQKIVAGDRNPGDRFAYAVDIQFPYMVLGSFRNDSDALNENDKSDAGAAYVFKIDEFGTWNQTDKLVASDRNIDDNLGSHVAISSTGILVGAPEHDLDLFSADSIPGSGAGYFYSVESCIPTSSEQTLTVCAGETVTVGEELFDSSGTYTSLLSSSIGCDSIVTTNLTVIPAPTYTQSLETCFGYPIFVGPYSHDSSGTFIDTITTIDGCDSIVTTHLTVEPENAVSQDITICWGESFTIGASTYSTTGTYVDVLTSSSLCDSTITTNLTMQLPVDASVSQFESHLEANTSGATYQWLKCDPYEVIPGATNQYYDAPLIGKYAVIVSVGECSDTSSCLYVDVLSINESNSAQVKLFPNPVISTLQIEMEASQPYSRAVIYDLFGKVVSTHQLSEQKTLLNLTNLSSGFYVIRLLNENSSTEFKFVKK
jgi:hypothetical protein